MVPVKNLGEVVSLVKKLTDTDAAIEEGREGSEALKGRRSRV